MRAWLVLLAVMCSGCLGAPPHPSSDAVDFPEWFTPTDEIRPGDSLGATVVGYSTLVPGGSPCTINFLFRNATDLFFGTAAHCLGADRELGSRLQVGHHGDGGRFIEATLAYSSWLQPDFDAQSHQSECNTDPTVSQSTNSLCWNDFALARIAPSDWRHVHPVPRDRQHLGESTSVQRGDEVWTRGEAQLRGGIPEQLDARTGRVVDSAHHRYLVQFGVPSTQGDSGSPVTTATGEAVGVLLYLHTAPPAMNGVARLSYLLEFARAAGHPVELVSY